MGYTLTDIVNELLIELGEGQSNKFARYYQLGTACLREQNMDLSGFPKIVSLTPNSNDTVDLPSDYMNYSRIAICDARGVLHSLGRNDNLCLEKSFNACGEPIRHGLPQGTSTCSSVTTNVAEVLPIWTITKVVFNPLVTHVTIIADGTPISNAVPVSAFTVNSIQDVVDDINGFGSAYTATFVSVDEFTLTSTSPINFNITYTTDDPGGTILSIVQTTIGVTAGTVTTNTCAPSSGCNTCSLLPASSAIPNPGWVTNEWREDNYRNGEVMGRFFGIGGGNNANGYYRIDVASGQILLAGGWAMCNGQMPSIILEYLADIEASGDDYVVHPFLIETVKDYIFWKSIARDRNRNANEKQMAMIDYQKSERLSRIRFNSRTGDEWIQAFRTGNQAAVKW